MLPAGGRRRDAVGDDVDLPAVQGRYQAAARDLHETDRAADRLAETEKEFRLEPEDFPGAGHGQEMVSDFDADPDLLAGSCFSGRFIRLPGSAGAEPVRTDGVIRAVGPDGGQETVELRGQPDVVFPESEGDGIPDPGIRQEAEIRTEVQQGFDRRRQAGDGVDLLPFQGDRHPHQVFEIMDVGRVRTASVRRAQETGRTRTARRKRSSFRMAQRFLVIIRMFLPDRYS